MTVSSNACGLVGVIAIWCMPMVSIAQGQTLPPGGHAGVTFAYKAFNFDLRYHDTNLPKEDCYVFTGDPGAGLNGHRDPVTNPAGLMFNWCSATFVVKAWVALN